MRPRHLLPLAALVLLVNGCSLFQPDAEDPEHSAPPTNCNWASMRGIAELVRIEDNTAVMDFFPGEIRFQTEAEDPSWAPGDEFKVLLETSDRPECGAPRVRELSPVGPDA